MDLDQLQKKWKQLDVSPASVGTSRREGHRRRHISGSLLNLNARLYRRMLLSSVACAMAPALLIPFSRLLDVSEATVVTFILFFLIMTVAYAYLAWLMGDTAYLSQPVVSAVRQIGRREICMRRVKIISRIIAIPVLVFLFSDIYADSKLHDDGGGMAGGLIGGLIGLICGIRIELSNRRIIRRIKSALEEMESGD